MNLVFTDQKVKSMFPKRTDYRFQINCSHSDEQIIVSWGVYEELLKLFTWSCSETLKYKEGSEFIFLYKNKSRETDSSLQSDRAQYVDEVRGTAEITVTIILDVEFPRQGEIFLCNSSSRIVSIFI